MENKQSSEKFIFNDEYNTLTKEEKQIFDDLSEPITELVSHYDKIFREYLKKHRGKQDDTDIFFDLCGIISGSITVFIKSLSDLTEDGKRRTRIQKMLSKTIVDMINNAVNNIDEKEKYV